MNKYNKGMIVWAIAQVVLLIGLYLTRFHNDVWRVLFLLWCIAEGLWIYNFMMLNRSQKKGKRDENQAL